MAFLGASHLFYSWAVLGLNFTSFVIVYCKAGILSLMVLLFVFFSLCRQIYAVLYVYVYHASFFKRKIAYILYMSMIAG